jgi:hypothetical protein
MRMMENDMSDLERARLAADELTLFARSCPRHVPPRR